MQEARWESRKPYTGQFSLTWKAPDGAACSAVAAGIDISPSGVGVECATALKPGAIVHVAARDGSMSAQCEVVHCTSRGAAFHIGFELRQELAHSSTPAEQTAAGPGPDYYEILQISRKADAQTIHRVFHIMAARFHPDNPETGDLEQFLRMKQAYGVLSDPERRREYDATLERKEEADGPRPIFRLKDFVTGVDAEANRRLGVLCLLYSQRQTDPDHPGVSLLDLEKEMGFPREYLSFTMWYLRSKNLVTLADNSDYALTADGADYVEEKSARNEIAARLLNPASARNGRPAPPPRRSPAAPNARLLA